MIIIYNKLDINKNFVKLDKLMVNLYNIPDDSSISDYDFPTSYLASNSSIFYGLSDFQFFDSPDIGFQIWVSPPLIGNTFIAKLRNRQTAYVVPRYTILAMLGSQLRCPNL